MQKKWFYQGALTCIGALFGMSIHAAEVPNALDVIQVKSVKCSPRNLAPDAECKQTTLPENYEVPKGRQIRLDITVLKARRQGKVPQAVFFLDGGPGQRVSESSDFYGRVWDTLRDTSDLVFVDQRGTGTTPDLHCPVEQDPIVLRRDLWPAADLAKCPGRLARSVDLTRYTTTDSARDLNNVRTALGYPAIDLVGYSYGTRLAQEYLRHYDKTVHSALLIGPDSPLDTTPAGLAQEADLAIAKLLDRCKVDPACIRAYPNTKHDFDVLKLQLSENDKIAQRSSSRATTPTISAGIVASFLRMMVYEIESAVELPKIIHALALGDPDGIVHKEILEWRQGFAQAAPWALFLSVTCAEDIPFIDIEKERGVAKGTLIGTYRLDQQVAACRAWPVRPIEREFHTAVATQVPVLLLVGEFDPATPAEVAHEIISRMPHGQLVIVPNRGHSMSESIENEWNGCLKKSAAEFIRSDLGAKVDFKCITHLAPPVFDVSPYQ